MSERMKQFPIRIYVETEPESCGECGGKDRLYTARVVVRDDNCPSPGQFPVATLARGKSCATEDGAAELALWSFLDKIGAR